MLSQIQRRAAASVLTRATASVAAASPLRCAAAAAQSASAAPRRPLSVRSRASAPPVTVAAEIPNVSNAPIRVAIKRDERFAKLTAEDIEHFRSIVGAEGLVQDEAQLQLYNNDWMKKFHGSSKLVLRPKNSAEVSAILRHCSARLLAVVPQGGNTGLVGGSVPVFDEVVLSLQRCNSILSFDEYSGIVTCEAGVILENLNAYLEERGFVMPLDLGAKGSCHVGGNVSTNAGGLRYVRYGSLHGNVLGMEMVLADGTIVDNLSTLRKDNTGYDIKQLFIGAEGTLGVVTNLSILAARKPKCQHVAVLGCSSYDDVLRTMQMARSDLLEIVSAIEFWDRGSLELVIKHIPNARDPLSSPYPFYMLLETSGSNSVHDQEKLSSFLESALGAQIVQDGILAQDTTQARALWQLRETITEGLAKEGAVYKYDISLPVARMYDLVARMKTRLGSSVAGAAAGVVGYGHLGDGNLHLNIHTPKFDAAVLNQIEPWLFEQTALERGSVSAEHGMGLSKAEYMPLSKSAEMIDIMRKVKVLFDPKGIINPYKVLPPVSAAATNSSK